MMLIFRSENPDSPDIAGKHEHSDKSLLLFLFIPLDSRVKSEFLDVL